MTEIIIALTKVYKSYCSILESINTHHDRAAVATEGCGQQLMGIRPRDTHDTIDATEAIGYGWGLAPALPAPIGHHPVAALATAGSKRTGMGFGGSSDDDHIPRDTTSSATGGRNSGG